MEPRQLLANGLAAQSFVPIRINAGGGAVVDDLQRTFVADRGFVGGTVESSDVIYRSNTATGADMRVGSDFSFSQRLPRGEYTVLIEVADPNSNAAGQRVFDVFAEGRLAIDHVDAVATYRIDPRFDNPLKVVWFAALADVRDGELNLRFQAVTGEALVSAITIYSNSAPAAILPYEQTPRTANGQPYEAAVNVQDASRLRNIGTSNLLFSNENRNRFPWSWQEMGEASYLDSSLHVSSAWRTSASPRGLMSTSEIGAFAAARSDFVLRTRGLNNSAPAEAILAYRNLNLPGDEVPVLRGDGHVELMTRDALRAELTLPDVRIDKNLGELSTQPQDPNMVLIRSRLTALSSAIQQYRSNNSNNYPPALGDLYTRNYVRDVSVFLNPRFPAEVPTGLTTEQMAAWINQNAGFRYNRLTRLGSWRDNVVVVFEDPRRVHGPVWMMTATAVRLYEPMWANELLERTSVYLWPTPPTGTLFVDKAKRRAAERPIELLTQ
jgi:hypothetical protein